MLVKNKFYLGRLHPYNAEVVFKDNCNVKLSDKKRLCIFLDLVRSLIYLFLLKQEENKMSLFGTIYDNLTTDQFMKTLAENVSANDNHLSFTFNKIKNVDALKLVLNKLDEKKLNVLFEKAEALKNV